jgi:hypothetical protein
MDLDTSTRICKVLEVCQLWKDLEGSRYVWKVLEGSRSM